MQIHLFIRKLFDDLPGFRLHCVVHHENFISLSRKRLIAKASQRVTKIVRPLEGTDDGGDLDHLVSLRRSRSRKPRSFLATRAQR